MSQQQHPHLRVVAFAVTREILQLADAHESDQGLDPMKLAQDNLPRRGEGTSASAGVTVRDLEHSE